ncbi:MAG TPA: ROK family protein [Phycisphaerae bacterium]|nr:ROK family protein [Phycisphaerae bacterium]
MPRHYIGIDLGGTNVKAGIADSNGRVSGHVSIPTGRGGRDLSADLVIARMVEAAKLSCAKAGIKLSDASAAGILSPGQGSLSKGIIYRAANLPLWRNVHLRAKVSKGLGLPAILENDAKAAAYGEWWVGAGKGKNLDSLFIITLGTGVGGGFVHERKVLHGAFDSATEIGHSIMVPGGDPCGCGQRGCLEVYASARYTGKRASTILAESSKVRKKSSLGKIFKNVGKVTAADIAQHAKAGDKFALEIWNETTHMLALACINICHYLDPQMIVLGGGMSAAGTFLTDYVEKHLRDNWWKMTPITVKIVLARLGNDAGVIGAAGVAKHAHETSTLPPIGK